MIPEKEWHAVAAQEILKEFGTDRELGLTSVEASSRLAFYGTNELEKGKKTSLARIFLRQFANTLVVILVVATAISALLGETFDAVVIFVIIFFVVTLGFIQEYRSEGTLKALEKLVRPVCTVIRDGEKKEIAAGELVPGDIVILEAGDRVPADSRLIEAVNLKADEAALTGESAPVSKTTTQLSASVAIADRTNLVFFGTVVTYGRGMGVVTATGMKTEFGKIAKEVISITRERPPLQRRMNEIGSRIGLVALSIITIVALADLLEEFFTNGFIELRLLLEVFLFGVSLAVAAVPEALPAIVTGSLAIGMRIMARQNALVRRMTAVETLGSTEVICSDKTGTLTKGEMTVRKLYSQGTMLDVSGAGYEPWGEVLSSGKKIGSRLSSDLAILARIVLICNDASLESKDGKFFIRGDPTEGALIVLAEKLGLHQAEVRGVMPRVAEVPFSSERRRMTTVNLSPDGSRTTCMKGAPETVLALSRFVRENGQVRELSQGERTRILQANEEMGGNGLRVLGVAEKTIASTADLSDIDALESDMIFLGLVGMSDPPRKEAVEAVAVAKRVGMRPIMITGDQTRTAVAIASELDIYHEGDLAVSGEELEHLSPLELEGEVEKITVYSRVSPLQKLKIVEAWKKKGRVVAMTGDGVNDAPALKRSDIGIAMGATGTDVAREASDIILADDNFATIVKAVEIGRWIYDNIKKYLAYLLQCNIVEVVVISVGALFILRAMGLSGEDVLPLLPVQILYINLATDGLPALALGFSPPDPDLMQRPPRPKNEPVFTWEIKSFIARALLIESPILLLAFLNALPDGIEAARSRLFLMFIFLELMIALNCRSLTFTIREAKPHKWLLLAVIWESALIVVLLQIPALRAALHLQYPTPQDIIWIVIGALTTLLSIELLKLYNSRKRRSVPNGSIQNR